MHPKLLLGSISLFLVVGSLTAQQAAPPAGAAQPGSTKTSATGADSEEPYIIELFQNKVVFEADGKGDRDLVLRALIKSESAVREFDLLAYPFASNFESLDIIYTRVRKPDGSVVETSPSYMQEVHSAVSREAPMYADQRPVRSA